MLEVYDDLGKKNKVKYQYLLDSFMNCFIEVNICYEENGCTTDYRISEECDKFHRKLFELAYDIYKG